MCVKKRADVHERRHNNHHHHHHQVKTGRFPLWQRNLGRAMEETSRPLRPVLSLSPQLIHPGVDVIGPAQVFKQRQQVKELRVVHVVEPRNHGNLRETRARQQQPRPHGGQLIPSGTHGVVGVEDVGGGRVVQDQSLVKVSAQTAQVLHVATLVEDARLSEQSGPEHAALVQEVRHRVCVLVGGGSRRRWRVLAIPYRGPHTLRTCTLPAPAEAACFVRSS